VDIKILDMRFQTAVAFLFSFSSTLPLQSVSSFSFSGTRSSFIESVLLSTILASRTTMSASAGAVTSGSDEECLSYDQEYPGTAVQRLNAVQKRVNVIAEDGSLYGKWEDVRRRLLWAGGLKDLTSSVPGQGYTGHSFNDWNHVDLTTMLDDEQENLNNGLVKGIAIGNRLGPGIKIASLPELGPGGSWSTCAMGCNKDPPSDVAHIQFKSRIAFKLVWVPNQDFDTFALVDDNGKLLAKGTPSDGPAGLPLRREREMNYQIMKGSKYAVAADKLARLDGNNATMS